MMPMGNYSVSGESQATGRQDVSTGGSAAGSGYRNTIINNLASGGSSLTASTGFGFDWKMIAVFAAAGLAIWYLLKK